MFERGWDRRIGHLIQCSHLALGRGSGMEKIFGPEEAAEYRRLSDRLPEAQMHAESIMQTYGVGSAEFIEAGSVTGAIIRRMRELMGDTSSF
jgi:hypothetical protein